MRRGSFELTLVILFVAAAVASGQDSLVQAFVSDGSVNIEAYFDDTNVTIYSATLDSLSEVRTLTLSGGESKVVALPEGNYAAESNKPVRVLGQPVPEQPKMIVTPTPATAQPAIQNASAAATTAPPPPRIRPDTTPRPVVRFPTISVPLSPGPARTVSVSPQPPP